MSHPITPPPELVQQWASNQDYSIAPAWMLNDIATRAAQWGADQELDACVKLLELSDKNARDFLYFARRPKPPSLKQQALEALDRMWNGGSTKTDWELFRRALEQLND